MRESIDSKNSFYAGWQAELKPYSCSSCQGVFLLGKGVSSGHCPFCSQPDLSELGLEIFEGQKLYTNPPEGWAKAQIGKKDLYWRMGEFVRSIPFPPEDCQVDKLIDRMQLLYLPGWWVDVDIDAQWNAEMGFEYEVVSHKEKFKHSNWTTEEHRRTLTRWEERIGTIKTTFHNTAANALEKWEEIENAIGSFERANEEAFEGIFDEGLSVQIPQIVPKQAWPNAEVQLYDIALQSCQEAAEAEHSRLFHWKASFTNQNWTQVLYPVFTTYYLDEEGNRQPVMIHGLTGKIYGRKKASLTKAKKYQIKMAAIILGLLTAIGLIAGLGKHVPFSMLLQFLALGAVGGIIYIVSIMHRAKSFNRDQPFEDLWGSRKNEVKY